jgi:hypothetical protein
VNAEAAALVAFPELRRLIDLREAGWEFVPTITDGRLAEVHGVRTRPGPWADALRVEYVTDAAVRCNHEGGVLWKWEGGLVEVVDQLIALPAPDDRCAPALIVARAPSPWDAI